MKSSIPAWIFLTFFTLVALASVERGLRTNWAGGPMHPSSGSHTMPEEDLANLWSAGRMVRAGRIAEVYSARGFQLWKQARFGPSLTEQDWIYPPSVFLVGVPLSFLPLTAAFLLWDAVTVALAVGVLRMARLPWPVVAAGVASPAVWRCLILGQYGTVTGALVVVAVMMAPRQPGRAGVLLGLSSIKPQQGLIVPVAWLAARHWRALAVVAATLCGIVLLVGVCFGFSAWTLFLEQSSAMGRGILVAPPPQLYINTGVSVFWMCRTLGGSVASSYAVQMVAAALAAAAGWRVWRMEGADPLMRMAVTVCLSLLITPYGYTSDMVAYSVALAAMAHRAGWRLQFQDALLWLWPVYCTAFSAASGILFTPVVVLWAAARGWRRLTPSTLTRRSAAANAV